MKPSRLQESAKKAIDLAVAIRNYWERELPKRHPNYPIVNPDEDSGPPPPEEKKLRQLLSRLPEDTLCKLALIMYLGRGDFDTKDLPSEYHTLKENFDSPAALIAHLMGQAPLADYLEEGLAILKSQHIDLDRRDLTTAGA